SLRHSYGQRSALPRSTRSAPAWLPYIHDCHGSGRCWIGTCRIQRDTASRRALSTKSQVLNTDFVYNHAFAIILPAKRAQGEWTSPTTMFCCSAVVVQG